MLTLSLYVTLAARQAEFARLGKPPSDSGKVDTEASLREAIAELRRKLEALREELAAMQRAGAPGLPRLDSIFGKMTKVAQASKKLQGLAKAKRGTAGPAETAVDGHSAPPTSAQLCELRDLLGELRPAPGEIPAEVHDVHA